MAKLKLGDPGEQWASGTMKAGLFRGRIELHHITLAGLAEALASQVDQPVIDTTKLTGFFDISLKWTPDNKARDDPESDNPSLYTAIIEQLGLKLEASHMPVEVIMISSIQKPSRN